MKIAVILAGGKSSRSGRIHKGCRQLIFRGKRISWLEQQVILLREQGYRQVVLATGYRPRQLLANVRSVVQQRHNSTPQKGPFSTLQQALTGLTRYASHVLLTAIDTPIPKNSIMFALHRKFKGKQLVSPVFKGRGGHPVLLSKAVVKQLMAVDLASKNARLDHQLRMIPLSDKARLNVTSPQVCLNLNNHWQWQHYKQKYLH